MKKHRNLTSAQMALKPGDKVIVVDKYAAETTGIEGTVTIKSIITISGGSPGVDGSLMATFEESDFYVGLTMLEHVNVNSR